MREEVTHNWVLVRRECMVPAGTMKALPGVSAIWLFLEDAKAFALDAIEDLIVLWVLMQGHFAIRAELIDLGDDGLAELFGIHGFSGSAVAWGSRGVGW